MTNEIKFDELKYRREAEEFGEIRARLKTAVRGIEVPGDLQDRVRMTLAENPPSTSWNRRLMSIAAGIAIVMGAWLTYQVGNVRAITAGRQRYVLAISQK